MVLRYLAIVASASACTRTSQHHVAKMTWSAFCKKQTEAVAAAEARYILIFAACMVARPFAVPAQSFLECSGFL